jgi:predicted cupin superfamily sugar epimerase
VDGRNKRGHDKFGLEMTHESLIADEVIAHLEQKPHAEGGWFGETFRNAEGHEGRAHSTAILFS